MAARALRTALVLVLLALVAAAPASAEPGFEYEEVHPTSGVRIGGFDSGAYNHGRFDGPLTPGKFVDPTGFAVDPVDNTVYVVDRTSSREANPTDWRIQEFSPKTGEVLGTTTFTLPNEPPKVLKEVPKASAIEGLAVDDKAGRLYALVVGPPPLSSPYHSVEPPPCVAQELLAWSTTPNAKGELEVAPGLPHDSVLHTTGAQVSSEEQLLLRPGLMPLYEPQGIAIDPLEVQNVDNPVVIEASESTHGYTIVQQVATQGAETGERLAHWSGTSVDHQLGGNLGPLGISTSPEGTLTVLLNATEVPISTSVDVVDLTANLSNATPLDDPANVPVTGDADQSPIYGSGAPFSGNVFAVTNPTGAGPQAVRLSASTPNRAGPYAGVIFSYEHSDAQVSPTAPPGSEYWISGENSSEEYEANLGVRLLEPETGGAISDLQGRTIVNTLGNAARHGPCNIGAPEAALAAGADGTLWILDRGPKANAPEARGQGREIIELAPRLSGADLCVKPTGTFTMTAPKSEQGASGTETETVSGEKTLEVPAGTMVVFNAESVKHKSGVSQSEEGVNRQGGKPFAYEWDLDGSTTGGPAHDGFDKVYEMVPPHYYFPPSSITHTYTSPGEYKVRFRMRSDYGVYTPPNPGTVIVTKDPFHPEPHFTATPSGPDQVTFNAGGSTPGVGKIINYHWNWGDGGEEDEDPQTPFVTHTYAEAKSYEVTLTVTNSAYQSATSAPQTVTVVAPPPANAAVLAGPLYDIPAPFALYPIPSVLPDRAPTRLAPHARFADGTVSVTLACPAAKKLCAGTISIETAAAIVAAKAGKGKHKPKKSRLLLGHAAFSIPGGQHRTVKVHLSAQGMALLERDRHLKTLLIVAAHDSLGDPATTTLALTLNAPAAHGSGSSGRDKHPKH